MVFNAVALCQGVKLSLEPFKSWIRGTGLELFPAVLPDGRAEPEAGKINSPPTLKEAEEQLIQEALDRSQGNQSAAAKLLGITRQALNRRLLTKKRRG